jgi:hypothetical protein
MYSVCHFNVVLSILGGGGGAQTRSKFFHVGTVLQRSRELGYRCSIIIYGVSSSSVYGSPFKKYQKNNYIPKSPEYQKNSWKIFSKAVYIYF